MGISHLDQFDVDQLDILYEDNHLIAVNKPACMNVQSDSSGDKPLMEYIRDYIKRKYHKPGNAFVGLIHRLDRPVSGVILFARTSKALERFNALFKEREVEKIYWAVVKNKPNPETNRLVHWLRKYPDKNITKAFDHEVPGSQLSELSYRIISCSNTYFLLEIKPITGRSHQIRAQLSGIGCPIRGDKKYGSQRRNPGSHINLHARSIRFVHPIKKMEIYIESPLPKDPFWQLFNPHK